METSFSGGGRENQRPWGRQATGKLYHLRLRVECAIFVIYKGKHFMRPKLQYQSAPKTTSPIPYAPV